MSLMVVDLPGYTPRLSSGSRMRAWRTRTDVIMSFIKLPEGKVVRSQRPVPPPIKTPLNTAEARKQHVKQRDAVLFKERKFYYTIDPHDSPPRSLVARRTYFNNEPSLRKLLHSVCSEQLKFNGQCIGLRGSAMLVGSDISAGIMVDPLTVDESPLFVVLERDPLRGKDGLVEDRCEAELELKINCGAGAGAGAGAGETDLSRVFDQCNVDESADFDATSTLSSVHSNFIDTGATQCFSSSTSLDRASHGVQAERMNENQRSELFAFVKALHRAEQCSKAYFDN